MEPLESLRKNMPGDGDGSGPSSSRRLLLYNEPLAPHGWAGSGPGQAEGGCDCGCHSQNSNVDESSVCFQLPSWQRRPSHHPDPGKSSREVSGEMGGWLIAPISLRLISPPCPCAFPASSPHTSLFCSCLLLSLSKSALAEVAT